MRVVGWLLTYAACLFLPRSRRRLTEELHAVYERYLLRDKALVHPILTAILISSEDSRFYSHRGFDPLAAARATMQLLFQKKLTGASTIEQQLVRTVTRQYQRSLIRKAREILLAASVEAVIPKRDIPGVYLSVAYFGWRMNGLREACMRLDIKPETMTMLDAGSIVARLKYPEPEVASPERRSQINVRTRYILRYLAKRVPSWKAEIEGVWANAPVLDL